jgi:signal transduction histidine kinase
VSNSGAVIAPQEAASLVRPFQRGAKDRTATPGLGIGLSIVDAVVAAHGGRLRLQPVRDGGLAADVTLPRHSSRLAAVGSTSAVAVRAGRPDPRVT